MPPLAHTTFGVFSYSKILCLSLVLSLNINVFCKAVQVNKHKVVDVRHVVTALSQNTQCCDHSVPEHSEAWSNIGTPAHKIVKIMDCVKLCHWVIMALNVLLFWPFSLEYTDILYNNMLCSNSD